MGFQKFISKDSLLYFVFFVALICLITTVFSGYQNIKKIENQKETSLRLMISKGEIISSARIMQMSAGLHSVTQHKKWLIRAINAKADFQNTVYKFKNTKLESKSEYYLKEIDELILQFENGFETYITQESQNPLKFDQYCNKIIVNLDNAFEDLLLHLHEDQLLIQRQAEITQHDELLTMSAYIASYDTSSISYWEQKYQNSDKALLKAFDNLTFALNFVPTEITSKTNEELVKIEKNAFQLINKQKADSAQLLLFSDNYQNLKKQYYNQTAKANSMVTSYLSVLQENATRPFKFLILLGSLCMISLIYVAYKIAQTQKQVNIKTEENIELEQYARIVSHDLKSPLRNISGFLSLLERKEKNNISEESREFISIVKEQTLQMGNMINGILKLSQVTSENQSMEKISIQQQLKQIIQPFTLNNRNIIVNLPDKEVDMMCSKIRFSQIFQNLISNAIKYSDKEIIEIDISAIDKGSNLTFSIKDNGPGIEKEYSDRIFGLFQTLGPKSIESTGIGLAIVKKIVDSVGGSIKLLTNTQPKQGACFEITLPKEWA